MTEMASVSFQRSGQWTNSGHARQVFPVDFTLHELFCIQEQRTPNAIAAGCEGEELTYHELDWRANQLAHSLQRLGVTRGTPVGLCTERSLAMLVGMLGILKAGGTYVPLEPTYPRERLAWVLKDTRATTLVTQGHLAERLSECVSAVLRLDVDWPDISREPSHAPSNSAVPDDVAYIIYTSGSTGVPKGVMVTHRNVVRLFSATQSWFRFDRDDVWTLFHSYAFDFSVWEIWGALLYGGRLVVVPYWTSRSPETFLQLICAERVTVLNQTPSAFLQLARAEEAVSEAPRPLSLRVVIFGGEALDFRSLRPWISRHGDLRPRLVNMYGITETTVHVTYRPLTMTDLDTAAGSMIGVPIPDLSLYVLDSNHKPAPIGVPGELYVGGAGVALGYLNRPELTAERFLVNPFDPGGSRLYKTGDLVRYLENGDLQYLGRADAQVKIRGFRVELGEIEAILSQHPSVRHTVVLARPGHLADKQLVAYVVATSAATSATELRQFLSEHLPDYMVPSYIQFLDALPLTSNGKIDRNALQEQQLGPASTEDGYFAPRTAVEESLAAIWSEVLAVQRVGVHDNFFELGGHSLLAAQILARIHSALRIDLPIRTFYGSPTIEGLARHITESMQLSSMAPRYHAVRRISRDDDLLMSLGQEWRFVSDQLLPRIPLYNIPFGFRVTGPLDLKALQLSVDALVARHEPLRTTFVEAGGQLLQVIGAPQQVPIRVIDVESLPEATREDEALRQSNIEAGRLFDRSRDQLLRISVVRLRPDEHIIVGVTDRIICDGWSIRIILEDLGTCYNDLKRGVQPSLPGLPFQHVDWAYWQRELLQQKLTETSLLYWKQHLGTRHPLLRLDLPFAPPRRNAVGYKSSEQTAQLPLELYDSMKALTDRLGVTLYMLLLAALNTLLWRHTGNEEISVLTPTANRTILEAERLVGNFAHGLIYRTSLMGDPSFAQLLERVRDVCLAAHAHQDIPFYEVVRAVQPWCYRTILTEPHVFLDVDFRSGEPGLCLSDAVVERVQVGTGVGHPAVDFLAVEERGLLRMSVKYQVDRHHDHQIARMLRNLSAILRQVIVDPDRRLSGVDVD